MRSMSILVELPFDQAIHVEPLVEALKGMAISELNRKIHQSVPNASNLVIQSLNFATNRKAIVFELSKDGQAMFDSGQAVFSFDKSEKLLPFIRDTKTGKIIEQFKGEDFPLFSKLASLTSIIVSAAHIVAGADNSRKINRIQTDVSFLIAVRKIDQMADLRSIYEKIRELFSLEKNQEVERDLKKEVRYLSKLRYTWIGEIEYHLNELSYIDSYESKNWLKKFFSSKKSIDNKISSVLTPFIVELQLIDFTIVLELLIYEYCGLVNHLVEVRMKDEVANINKIRSLLKTKSQLLMEEDILVESLVEGFDELIKKCECFVSDFKPEISTNINDMQQEVKQKRTGRNELCPCGSTLKYKNCCIV